jgi:hypothetical protein
MGQDEIKMSNTNDKASKDTDPVASSKGGEQKVNEEASSKNDSDAPTAEEKMAIDAAVRNIEEHAQIGDPVEPPARNARKSGQGLPSGNNEDVAVTFLPMSSKSILSRLFDPDRKQKPQLWEHIKLVAPGPADQPPPGHIKWRSKGTYQASKHLRSTMYSVTTCVVSNKRCCYLLSVVGLDAVSAYCLKCRKQFTYTKGTSKTISRHMQAYHGLVLKDEKDAPNSPAGKRSGSGSTDARPLKKRKPEFEQSAQVLLLKWVVSSFQPWSIVESAGIKDLVTCLSDSFELPTTEGIIQIAMDHVEKVKLEIRRVLKDADGFSLVCQTFRSKDGNDYTSARAIFCTSSFERKTVCLGVMPGEGTKEAISSLLNEYSLSLSKVSHVTVTGVSESPDLGLDSSVCVLYKMDSMVKEVCSSKGMVDGVIAQALASTGSRPQIPSYASGVYTALQALDSPEANANWKPDKGQTLIVSVLTTFLKPIFDAHQTLSGAFSTVGLAIPVVRRIRDVLADLDVKELTKGSKESQAVSAVKSFCNALMKAFSSSFAAILDADPPAMWTIPIDPRLIHMGGLSDKEKESVKKILVEKVTEKKLVAEDGEDTAETSQSGPKPNKKSEESSTMGGIFWGDDSGKAGDQTEAAIAYARANVDRYFTTVKSQRRIEDPLVWWNTNQKDFPELHEIARVWLGATAVGPSNDKRHEYPEEKIELMAFLHENADMILGNMIVGVPV